MRNEGAPPLEAALERLQRYATTSDAQTALRRLEPHLRAALTRATDTERVLAHLEHLLQTAPDGNALLSQMAENPRQLERVISLFAASHFLSEILLQDPAHLTLLLHPREELARPRSVAELYTAVGEHIAQACSLATGEDALAVASRVLRRFQRRELLRIGACDVWDLWDLDRVTRQLSNLAEALVRAALDVASTYTGIPVAGFTVLALGKLGGRELNYSSDIDLLFLAAEAPERYIPLAERLIDLLARVTDEGFLYRVDMRLRPWGRTGPLVTSVRGYCQYLQRHARLWERQALLKARPIAGDRALGAAVIRRLPPYIFGASRAVVRAEVREMKARIEEELRRKGRHWGEVKLGEGSIRDVEFVVQYLQLIHGGTCPGVRGVNTRRALARLHRHGILPTEDYRVLLEGYTFLRTVEHHLQLMHNQQTHRLPEQPTALKHLAYRLGYTGEAAAQQLAAHYEHHRQAIREVYRRYLEGSERPTAAFQDRVLDHVSRMTAAYAEAFDRETIRRHAALAARLSLDNLVEVDARHLGEDLWQVTIVAYDYLGELSLITGLLFVYGFTILNGRVFTYEEDAPSSRRKIVDVFTVRPVHPQAVDAKTWQRYRDDLEALLRHLEAGDWETAHGALAQRVAEVLSELPEVSEVLYPVDITIDNTTSPRYTILHIEAPDTPGFLYEFTHALAFQGIYIARVDVETRGTQVRDTLWITDAQGRKIEDPEKQQEVRAATVLVKQFTHLLPNAPDPRRALLQFRQFVRDLFTRPHWVNELTSLQQPAVLEALTRLLGISTFLWEDFLRMQYEQLFPVLQHVEALAERKSKATLWFDLRQQLERAPDLHTRRKHLNTFKDREMFRIDMRYILGQVDFEEFSAELTDLAEVVVDAAFHLCREHLETEYGHPHTPEGHPSAMVVCGLGKLGGREMGIASDLELMFIYRDGGMTSGPQRITTAEFYERLVQCFLETLKARREGIFEVDLQLRPYGKAGSLAVSLRAFAEFFHPDGPAWPYERQALIRLRPIAGDEALGQEVQRLRDAFVYTGEPFDTAAMRAMRERQLRHLVRGGTLNAKFSPGGLVDIEYLVQGLQITYGHPYPELRTPNTLEAMQRLAELRILARQDYLQLRAAYRFLRWLIEALRIVRGHAGDLTIPPPESEAFRVLARRLGYGHDRERLWQDILTHMAFVRELQARLL